MTKPNPRYEAAPIGMFWYGDVEFMKALKLQPQTNYRYANWQDADAGRAIPPWLVQQPDGTWQESFFPEQQSVSA